MTINDNEDDEVIINELKNNLVPEPEPKQGAIGIVKEVLPKVKFNSDNVCHFFATNKCKFGKECRKEHPKICQKFKKSGLVKFNKNGCSENCEFYHPKACFDSMKTKICRRTDCKFFHTAGTKKEDNSGVNANSNSGNTGNSGQAGNSCNSGNSCNAAITGNNCNNFNNGNPSNKDPNNSSGSKNSQLSPVFQEARQPWEIALERMASQLEKMMNLQLSFQSQIQPLLQPQRNSSQ